MAVKIKVSGERALYTRPELSVERVTYDAMTPSAAVGILEAIHWRPSIKWVIDRITVLKPIKTETLKRNEVAIGGSARRPYIDAVAHRMQRQSIILRDVAYVIEAHGVPTGKRSELETAAGVNIVKKHETILMRRTLLGQCHHQPVLGTREFPARFELCDGTEISSFIGERDLGLMLHSIDHDGDRKPRMFRAVMRDGVFTVPLANAPDVYR